MGEFEDIVSDLQDIEYTSVDVKISVDAAISGGFLHHDDCQCDNRVIVMSFKFQGDQDDINIAVIPGTPLWDALADGRFHAKFQERMSETS